MTGDNPPIATAESPFSPVVCCADAPAWTFSDTVDVGGAEAVRTVECRACGATYELQYALVGVRAATYDLWLEKPGPKGHTPPDHPAHDGEGTCRGRFPRVSGAVPVADTPRSADRRDGPTVEVEAGQVISARRCRNCTRRGRVVYDLAAVVDGANGDVVAVVE